MRGISTLAPHISKALLHPSFDKSLQNSTTSRISYHIFLDQFVLFTFEEEHTLLLIETVFFSKLAFSRVGQDSPYFQPNFIIYSLSETIKIHSMCKKITVTTSNGWDMSAGEYGVYEENCFETNFFLICTITLTTKYSRCRVEEIVSLTSLF